MTSSSRIRDAAYLRAAVSLAAIVIAFQGIAQAQAARLSFYEGVEPHMGTLMRIELYAQNEEQAKQALRAAFDRIAQLDDTLSDYKPASELDRITEAAIGHPVPVSEDLFRVLSAAQKLSQESDGAFDITLGPLTHLWRAARKKGRAPSEEDIRAASARCGYRKMHLDREHRTVLFDMPGMQLDAGGIAKGYAADEALRVLSKLGIHSALVAASGDLAFSDAPPGKPGWQIGIDSLDTAQAPLTRTLILSNGAVSTSGDMEQHLDVNGTRYSHIVDPRTGEGLTRRITATVLARHGMDADGTTKVVSVLGQSRGLAFIEHHPCLAALVVVNGNTKPRILESSKFRELSNPANGHNLCKILN